MATNPFDLRNIEWPKFELPDFELPKFELPEGFELPKFELPEGFELPKFELPEGFELPTIEQLTEMARDAAYVGIGLAAMTVERMQAFQNQVVELVKQQVERVREAA